ncbi:MAG: hypothetical protein O2V44_10175, partial [Candidatus Bathyarchaeota archaeon]|nr:hypothetical protein [Candidatus Bathyarchaeota archaeon]
SKKTNEYGFREQGRTEIPRVNLLDLHAHNGFCKTNMWKNSYFSVVFALIHFVTLCLHPLE